MIMFFAVIYVVMWFRILALKDEIKLLKLEMKKLKREKE